MYEYPMKFQTFAASTSGIQTEWKSTSNAKHEPIPVSIPPEFQGPGKGYSPEDLYSIALQNCFIATFKVFAEKSRLRFESIEVEAALEVDRNAESKPWMARIHFIISLFGVEQSDNAKRILERTSQNCMILNSVQTAKTFEFRINPIKK